MITSATEEIQMLAYLLRPSAKPILGLLNDAARRGIRITIIMNSIQSQPEVIRKWLKNISSDSPLVKVIDFKRQRGALLHAKVLVVDRKKALVGSANFSWGGMVGNYEVGVTLEGECAWKMACIVDRLASVESNGD